MTTIIALSEAEKGCWTALVKWRTHQSFMFYICTLFYTTILLLIIFLGLVQLSLCNNLIMQRICSRQHSTGSYRVSLFKVCLMRKHSKFNLILSMVIIFIVVWHSFTWYYFIFLTNWDFDQCRYTSYAICSV